MLGFPAETSHAFTAGADIDDEGGPASDSVAVLIVRIRQGGNRFIRNGLHQTGAKHWNRNPAGDHVRLGWNPRLALLVGQGKQVIQCAAAYFMKSPFLVHIAGPQLRDRADTANRRSRVTLCASQAIERRPQSFTCLFHLQEIVQADPEQLKLGGRDSGERIARLRGPLRPSRRHHQQ